MPQVPKTHVLEEGCRTLLLGQRNAPSQGVSRRKGLARSGISRRSFVLTLWLRCAYAPGGLARVSRGSRERRGLAKVVAGSLRTGGSRKESRKGLASNSQLLAGRPSRDSRSFSRGRRVLAASRWGAEFCVPTLPGTIIITPTIGLLVVAMIPPMSFYHSILLSFGGAPHVPQNVHQTSHLEFCDGGLASSSRRETWWHWSWTLLDAGSCWNFWDTLGMGIFAAGCVTTGPCRAKPWTQELSPSLKG